MDSSDLVDIVTAYCHRLDHLDVPNNFYGMLELAILESAAALEVEEAINLLAVMAPRTESEELVEVFDRIIGSNIADLSA